ncbi:hypothetical protein P0Y35_05420 [Kiritimatiellaeota bacterium B1221]|nr:hypothetical protein [Kiritimatiellaeota bacterium B1221]
MITKQCSFSTKRGSALLLTLLIVSLLLVIVLSFVVFVRMQLREVTNGQNLLVARQNARLGLELAVAELQKYAGADQRVSAPATTVYPAKDFDELYDGDADEGSSEMFSLYRNNASVSSSRSYLSKVGTYTTPNERQAWDADLASWWNDNGRNPHWVGIFNSSLRVDRATDPSNVKSKRVNPGDSSAPDPQFYEQNTATLYGEFDRGQLPVWLISGNEQLDFDPLSDSAYPADYATPENVTGDPDAEGSELVWMVGEGSATLDTESVDGLDGRVKAPRVEVSQGHYAYWVSDESTKANFSVREPQEYADASQNTVEYRNRLQVPQRVGWERMRGFADVFDSGGMDVNDPNFAKVMNPSQIMLVDAKFGDPAFNEPVKANFHHVTSTSKSLLTDTALGGLKKDLTRYLEDGNGLDDDDPIADPERYDVDDPRFATYGGTNTGFPHDSDEALDGVPTWGQIRSWYLNEATGSGAGSIDPDVDAGVAPVLAYVHFQNGISYDGATNMMRIHWAPMVVLWNPYDVSLNSETYDIDLGLMTPIDNLLVVNEDMADRSKLAERAALDPEADWQMWPVAGLGGDEAGPGGKPLLTATSAADGTVTISNFSTTTPGNVEIFKVQFDRSDSRDTIRNPPPETLIPAIDPSDPPVMGVDVEDRYMVKLTGDPDEFNGGSGPWVYDTTATNATSDAFGRIYYATTPGQSSNMYHSRNWTGSYYANSWGLLANKKKVMTSVNPHDTTWNYPAYSMPVDRPFPLRLTSDFEPGEVKVFTLGAETEWTTSNRMTLVNDYDPDMPVFFWMNLVEIVDGPSSAEAQGLRWMATLHSNYSKGPPSVKMSIGNKVFFETESFGVGGGSTDSIMGDDFSSFHSFTYIAKDTPPSSNPDAFDGDKDGDGSYNKNEPYPKFVKFWRPLYDSDNFYANLRTQTGRETTASNWSFGESYIAPFRNNTDLGGDGFNALHKFLPVFSRYNLGAQSFVEHPLTEQTRGIPANDVHPDVNGGSKGAGLTQYSYQQGTSGEVPWDSNQVVGAENGFVLTGRGDDGSATIRGLTHVAIRNAKRADSEILSLGQLQQINLSPYFWQPAFPIGNSDASPYVDREGIAGIHSRVMGYDYYSPHLKGGARPNHARPTSGGSFVLPTSLLNPGIIVTQGDDTILFNGTIDPYRRIKRSNFGGNTMLDMSYVLNENIWDHYFLSTMSTAPSNLEDPLSNARLRFNDDAHSATASELMDFDESAAYLETVGALNVNSTSVEAWKALLTSFRGLKLDSGTEENPDETVPVTRTLTPINDPVTFDFSSVDDADIGAESSQKDYSQLLSGFRYLDDDMIQALAERIVDEVRLRGPFYSMSDFVNRRLAPPAGSHQPGSEWYTARTDGTGSTWMATSYDPFPGLQGLNGALQRAINLSGINGGVNHPDLGDDGNGTGSTYDMVYSVRIRNGNSYTSSGIGKSTNSSRGSVGADSGFRHSVDPTKKSHLDSEHAAGAPAGEAGQLLQGAPGFVTQGDLLAMIAPALTARGDTFKIRAYGDSSGLGDADARAWLEAIVQRIPEPVTPDSSDEWRPTDSFGRRFKVVSVRWLTPEEI